MQISGVAGSIRAALVTGLLILTGCGQKGPLYLPQNTDAIPEDIISGPASAEAAMGKDQNLTAAPSDSQQ